MAIRDSCSCAILLLRVFFYPAFRITPICWPDTEEFYGNYGMLTREGKFNINAYLLSDNNDISMKLFYLTAICISYLPELYAQAAAGFPETFIQKQRYYSDLIHTGYIRLMQELNKTTFYSTLSTREYRLVYLSTQGYSNKKIAEILGTTEFYVSKKFSEIYHKLNVNCKSELVALFTTTFV